MSGRNTGIQKSFAITLLILGLVLMTGKIIIDSEPGAIPVVLTLVGVGWLTAIQLRTSGR